jgi:hypothetical protein
LNILVFQSRGFGNCSIYCKFKILSVRRPVFHSAEHQNCALNAVDICDLKSGVSQIHLQQHVKLFVNYNFILKNSLIVSSSPRGPTAPRFVEVSFEKRSCEQVEERQLSPLLPGRTDGNSIKADCVHPDLLF